jgi:hypothetical protein
MTGCKKSLPETGSHSYAVAPDQKPLAPVQLWAFLKCAIGNTGARMALKLQCSVDFAIERYAAG